MVRSSSFVVGDPAPRSFSLTLTPDPRPLTPFRSMHQRTLIKLIIVGVLCWGAFHAVGAYTLNHNPARAAVVFSCTLLFLGAWIAVLRVSKGRMARRAAEREAEAASEGGDEDPSST